MLVLSPIICKQPTWNPPFTQFLLFGDSILIPSSTQKNTSFIEIKVFHQETHVRHRSPEQQCLMIKRLIISISIYKMVLISKQISSSFRLFNFFWLLYVLNLRFLSCTYSSFNTRIPCSRHLEKKWRPLPDFRLLFEIMVPKDVSYQISCLHHKLKIFFFRYLLSYKLSCGNFDIPWQRDT